MTDFVRQHAPVPSLRTALALDAAFEFAAGVALLLASGMLGEWLAIGAAAGAIVGIVFVVAGVAIVGLLRSGGANNGVVRTLVRANVVGGCAGWIVTLVFWSRLDPGGRAALGTASDLLIAIGVLELLALRRAR